MKVFFHSLIFSLLVSPVFAQFDFFNNPPTIDEIDDYGPVLENSGNHMVLLTGISSGDTNKDQIVTITVSTDNNELISNLFVEYDQGSTAVLRFGLKPNANGKAEITVLLDDNQRFWNTTSESFEVTVEAVNGRPSFALLSDRVEVEENEGKIEIKDFAFNMDDGDPEEDQDLEFETTIKNKSEFLSFKSAPIIENDGDLKFETRKNAFGQAVISVVLNDDGGTNNGGIDQSHEATFTIYVKNINRPPTLDDIPSPLTIIEDAGEQRVKLSGISSGDLETQILEITATSNNPSLVSEFGVVYNQGETEGELYFSPNLNKFGRAVISVTVNDGQPDNNLVTKQFTLIVNPVADTPSITNAIYQGGPYTSSGLVISRNAADGEEVTHFKITEIKNGKLYHNNGTSQILNGNFITYGAGAMGLKFAPNLKIGANGSFKVQAATGNTNANLGGNVVVAQILISNDPPEILTQPDTLVEITEPYYYEVIATDPNEFDILTFTVQIPDVIKAWLNVNYDEDNKASILGTPPSGSAGVYPIYIKVEDQFGEYDEQSYSLYVEELNKLPVLTPFSKSIMEDDTIMFSRNEFSANFFDEDGDILQFFKLVSTPQYGTIYVHGNVVSTHVDVLAEDLDGLIYVPDNNYHGLDIFDWNASDGEDYAQVPQRLNVFISSVNDPPEIVDFEINPFTFEYADDHISLTDSGKVVDADGDRLEKADIRISHNYTPIEDTIFYEEIEGLTFNWVDSSGVLHVRGPAYPNVYQDIIRSLKYVNMNNLSPSGRSRQIEIVLYDADTSSIPYVREIEFVNTFVALDIPTGFTPNQDGVNDTWNIKNLNRYEDFLVSVYSRSGQLVYTSDNYIKEWDGRHNGNLVPVGTYYYLININKFQKAFTGSVSVLR